MHFSWGEVAQQLEDKTQKNMKKQIILWMALTVIAHSAAAQYSAATQYETKLREDLFVSKLSDTVYVVTHYFPWESNSLVVKASAQEVVLIDTPYDTSATALMLDWVLSQFGPVRITAINTGFHVDNLGGNQYLRENGIDIYGADRTCELIDERGFQTQQQLISWLTPGQEHIKEVYETMVFTKPNKVFPLEEGIFLRIGDLDFEVFFPGESHSPDNVVVYISECCLLFGGCMVKALHAENLGFTGDANLSEWPLSLKVLQQKYPHAKTVIPHHGMWGDMSLVQHTIDLLTN